MGIPNGIDLDLLSRLLAYSDRYDISVQFWASDIGVYIVKNDVDLASYGGSFDFAIGKAIAYLDRINCA